MRRVWKVVVTVVGLGISVGAVVYVGNHFRVDALISALENPEPEIRRDAAKSLGKTIIRDARAVEPLIAALEGDEASVRASAAVSLGLLKDDRAANPLILALQDLDDTVVVAAASALCKLGPGAVRPLLEAICDEDPQVRAHAAEALACKDWGWVAEVGKPAVEPLIRLLTDCRSCRPRQRLGVGLQGRRARGTDTWCNRRYSRC